MVCYDSWLGFLEQSRHGFFLSDFSLFFSLDVFSLQEGQGTQGLFPCDFRILAEGVGAVSILWIWAGLPLPGDSIVFPSIGRFPDPIGDGIGGDTFWSAGVTGEGLAGGGTKSSGEIWNRTAN